MEPERRAPVNEGHGAPDRIRRDPGSASDLPEKSQPSNAATGLELLRFLPETKDGPTSHTVPNIAAIRTEGHDISLINHGLQVRFEKRSSHGWSMLNSYTWQHTIGQATESETPNSDGEPQDTYNMRAERGNLTPDFRHQFTSAWSYEHPVWSRKAFLQRLRPHALACRRLAVERYYFALLWPGVHALFVVRSNQYRFWRSAARSSWQSL